MVAAGAAWFLSTLSSSNLAAPYTIGVAFDLLPAVLFLHVFLAFPSGFLVQPFERALVAAGYLTAFGVQFVGMGLGGFGSDNLLALTAKPDAASSLLQAQLVVLSALCLAGIGILFMRRRRAVRPMRRWSAVLVDSFGLALAMGAFLFLSAAYGWVSGRIEFETTQRVTFFVLGLAPLAFLVGLLDSRLARSDLGTLFVELHGDPAPDDLRKALARALRDPSVALAYWLPDYESYADLDGRPIEVPGGDGRAATLIERNGNRVAALLHDPALEDEPELLDAVSAAAGIAIENARLQAQLAARLEELRGSRARAIEAGQAERKLLERNLHDGAQQRLVALTLRLALLKKEVAGSPAVGEQFEEVQSELAQSLEELRDLARGIHPAVLSGHGLAIALEQAGARAPVPVELTIEFDGRLPEPVEVAAYYVVTESLANMAKHAQASSATIDVSRVGAVVVVEVVDDGIGGADSERGSGIRGLGDRVEALGGRLRVWTPKGGGTRVRAEIPCE
jgi:signal transduction histidine kinase